VSGFFGIVREDGKALGERLLQEIAEELRFRGPDGVSVWAENGIGGCFALMRTGPGKQSEQQPVESGGRYRLWGDIRVDGPDELREQLGEEVRELAADASSEEYFLRAWRKWGARALEKIAGDFSLGLWDALEQTLWCARDFVGARPLYYARVGAIFCFSNTLDLLRRVPEVSNELDEAYMGDFLLEGWNMEPSRTVYRDIRRLPSGHVLKFCKGETTLRRFQKLAIEEPLRLKRAEEYVESFRALFRAAVADRLPHGATALYLSGGVDSSAVCVMAGQLAAERGQKAGLKAFTVSWEPQIDDQEPEIAKLTAKHLGIAQEIFEEAESIAFEGADTTEGRTPEPSLDLFFARSRRQYRRMAEHSRVVLSGDGGDDVLVGQGWPYLVHSWREGTWKEAANDFGGFVLAHGRLPPLRGGFRSRIEGWLKRGEAFEGYPQWLNQDFESRAKLRERWLELSNRSKAEEHPVHPRAYTDLHSGHWGEILEMEDTAWTQANLETRVPFLDLRVLRFLLRVPPIPWCVDKELCRRAMKGLLPPIVLTRPKTPLPMDTINPVAGWKRGPRQLEPPSEAVQNIKRFVNWEKWCETFCSTKGSLSWLTLRPLSLWKWLKAIEIEPGIK
jgi:asparagine synthase (glutamine-hydrolysing)